VSELPTPREFCAALAAEGINAAPGAGPYGEGAAEGVLGDGRAWSVFAADENSTCPADEPMPGLLWLEFTSAEDEGTNPLGFLENCTPAQAKDAITRAAAGDYSALTPFETAPDAVLPHPGPAQPRAAGPHESAAASTRPALSPGRADHPDAYHADASDLAADAMRALYEQVLAAVPPSQRNQADDWIADLLDLATDNLSPAARAEVIRQALSGSQGNPGGERDFEVSLGTRIVTAGSPREAAVRARAEWREETEHPGYQPGPNEVYEVRPAHSRGRWQLIDPDQPEPAPGPAAPDTKKAPAEAGPQPQAPRPGPAARTAPASARTRRTEPEEDTLSP
jgi:hypothetical protein